MPHHFMSKLSSQPYCIIWFSKFSSGGKIRKTSSICFEKEAQYLNSILKSKNPKELSDLMSISSKIANLNYERNHSWSLPFTNTNARQAVYAFSGDVYRGLDAYSIDDSRIDFLQNSVRILSGLYGLIKPLDLIQPYRLEMGTKLSFDNNKNLYDFLIKLPKNSGKGEAVKKGLIKASGQFILFQDADLEYDPRDYEKLLEPVLRFDADLVIGFNTII